jgi:hypothetical protein
MRLISFALTTPQFLDGSKDVTRRMGWLKAKAGDKLCAVKKCMGFRPGESVERLGVIRLVAVRREPLRAILDDLEYGFDETRREGFPAEHHNHFPSEFVSFFCRSHKGCTPDSVVTRLEFERLAALDGGAGA